MSEKLIVRVSDTNLFRQCRVKWDFASKVRMNYELTRGIEPLDFGSAIHEAMEIIYDPERWNDPRNVVYQEAIAGFMNWMFGWKKRMVSVNSFGTAEKERWEELVELGKGMLNHYKLYSAEHDHEWEPYHTEIEFELPVIVPDELLSQVISKGVSRAPTSKQLQIKVGYHWRPVFFRGRIDAIMRNRITNKLWLWDHKTAKTLPEQTTYLDMDSQGSCYMLASRELGFHVEGVVFNQLRKKHPEAPAVLKSGQLSKSKSAATTVELYRREIAVRGLNPSDYEHFLQNVFVGQEYFRRADTLRSNQELDFFQEELCMIAIEMYTDPFIYRTPNMFMCNSCQFKEPCQMRGDGSDWEWFLKNNIHYTNRRS